MSTPLWLSGGCQCNSRLVSDWHSRCNASGWPGTVGHRESGRSRAGPARAGAGRRGRGGTRLTSLRGPEGHLAGGPQSSAVKGLHLQVVGAVGPQASQDGTGGIGGHHHVAFVDMPFAVLPLTALPPVCHLQGGGGRRPNCPQWGPFPPTPGTPGRAVRRWPRPTPDAATPGGLTPHPGDPPTPMP